MKLVTNLKEGMQYINVESQMIDKMKICFL